VVWATVFCSPFLDTLQVRAYLRQRAGLPPVTTGTRALNRGHLSLFERELLFLHDVLPKDSEVRDGLQLLDGGDPNRHSIPPTGALEGTSDGAPAPTATPVAPTPVVVPVVVGAAPSGVVLPVPSQPMLLEPLPAHLTGRAALPTPTNGTVPAVRHDERVQDDEEEEEEIRPVSDNRAAQWLAYRAAGF